MAVIWSSQNRNPGMIMENGWKMDGKWMENEWKMNGKWIWKMDGK